MPRAQEPERAPQRNEANRPRARALHPQRRLPLPCRCELPAAPCRGLWMGLADVEAAQGLRFSLCWASQARSQLRCPGNSQEVTTKGTDETSLTAGLLNFFFSILAFSFKLCKHTQEYKASYALAPSSYSSHADIASSSVPPH